MKKVSIIGLGYVGLPLAMNFAQKIPTIGYDIKKDRINQLNSHKDIYNQISKNIFKKAKKIKFTNSLSDVFDSKIIIVTLPTPVNKNKKPDLKNIKNLCKKIGKGITKNTIIIFESTLYPGATRNEFLPLIKSNSKLKYLKDFFVGYSPERINVGDKKNLIQNITKLISGDCNYSTKKIANIYKLILKKNIYITKSIEVAEAAKVFENTQRDVNISLMNELSMICNKINLKTKDVLDASSTKWNFLKFHPGLVGGHCISVDPYYLSYCAKNAGHKTILINAGRKINDNMPKFIYKNILKDLGSRKRKVLILGLTFKENCSDIRDSKIFDLIQKLKNKHQTFLHDPYAIEEEVYNLYSQKMYKLNELPKKIDCIVINLKHDYYKSRKMKEKIIKMTKNKGYIYDLKGLIDNKLLKRKKIKYFSL